MFHSEKQNTRQTGMVLMENSESLHMIHKHEREREGKGREGEGEGEAASIFQKQFEEHEFSWPRHS